MKAVEELKYYPTDGTSRTLGLLVLNLETPFFLDVFRVVEEGAGEKGNAVLIANTDYDPERLASNVLLMMGGEWRGWRLLFRRSRHIAGRVVAA